MLSGLRKLWTARSWVWAAAGLLLAGGVHVVSVLAMPRALEDTGWLRVFELAEERKLKILPRAALDQQLLPFFSTSVRAAICRFDLGEDAVVIRAQLRQPAWHVALFDRNGDNYYTVSGADIRREALDLVVTRRGTNVTPPRGLRSDAVLVEAAAEPGFAIILAPLMGAAFEAEAVDGLKQASCS